MGGIGKKFAKAAKKAVKGNAGKGRGKGGGGKVARVVREILK